MAKSIATSNSILKLIFNATAWANMADNAATSPYTNLYLSLHTADPGTGNNQTTNETSYTNYVRAGPPLGIRTRGPPQPGPRH